MHHQALPPYESDILQFSPLSLESQIPQSEKYASRFHLNLPNPTFRWLGFFNIPLFVSVLDTNTQRLVRRHSTAELHPQTKQYFLQENF